MKIDKIPTTGKLLAWTLVLVLSLCHGRYYGSDYEDNIADKLLKEPKKEPKIQKEEDPEGTLLMRQPK